jgi:hypothetical protein
MIVALQIRTEWYALVISLKDEHCQLLKKLVVQEFELRASSHLLGRRSTT